MNESIEQIQSGKYQLKKLELENKYVFHGSESSNISILEPRQAYEIKNGKKIEDDKPAIHASPLSDIAIFMAIINMRNCPKGFNSSFKYKDGKLVLYASQHSLDQLNNSSRGYVYVFLKDTFISRGRIEVISYNESRPVQIVEVTKADLSEDIEIR